MLAVGRNGFCREATVARLEALAAAEVAAIQGVTARPEAGRYTSGNILMNDLEDWLLIALDGKFRELRQDNHVTSSVIMVFDAATGFVEAFDLMDLPPRNPCGPGERWPLQDLAPAAKEKATLY